MAKFVALMVFWSLHTMVFCLDPYFWHITDMHYDPTYHDTQESCNDVIAQPGQYGDYECDSPYRLVRSSIKAMNTHGREPKFIIYTGDTPFHPKNETVSNFNSEYVMEMVNNITNIFNESFRDTTYIMTIGNHDYYPIDQLPGETNPIYEQMAELWSTWLTPEAKETFKIGAYYTMLVNTTPEYFKIRVVVLNTNLYIAENEATKGVQDPAGQYAWLEQVLHSARLAHEIVHLIGHVPNGVMPAPDLPMWMTDSHNNRLVEIIRDYGDVIAGYYSCHEHLDSFRLFYKDGVPVTALYVAPSVTPWRARLAGDTRGPAHDPGIRKVIYDEFDGHLVDLWQYHLHLPKANNNKEDNWVLLYKFTGLYDVDNVTAAALHELAEGFKLYGDTHFHNYYDMTTVGGSHSSIGPCSCTCKFLHICSIQNVDYADFINCYEHMACDGCVIKASVSLAILVAVISKLIS